jgi:hypothetical protein
MTHVCSRQRHAPRMAVVRQDAEPSGGVGILSEN